MTKLYRVENPNIAVVPNGVTSHRDLVGQWFTPNVNTASNYLPKATKQAGARLVIAEVPTTALPALHVSKHPIASKMDVEDDNYIVPRDGTFPTSQVELDVVLGELCGKLANVRNLVEARQKVQKVVETLGAAAIP
ncbi:MAG: hypothetical protein WAW63_05185 [Candidatus Saccharimonadales bacterium]